MSGIIKVSNIRKSFGSLEVLRSMSLERNVGSVTALIGPSGSGKSTFLRCLNLLTMPDSGSITIGDISVVLPDRKRTVPAALASRLRRSTGMVFQHFNLFPHMTALQNVMEGPRTVKRLPVAQCREIAVANLAKVGLLDKAESHPASLSGGQKQRVAIARALAMEPRVMLFDEATSALDPELVGEVLTVIRDLASEGMTMLLVTHEIGFAREVADTTVFMRDGVIIEEGPSRDVIDHPQHELTQSFLARFGSPVAKH
ncbi:MAG: amino acid ABC transporter ATP-binding protein [Hyphomicrobiales bacterium]|nr:MAG: amino acid ABC transporter ATP-binding protein [Hyphomicrobiales bacterium]